MPYPKVSEYGDGFAPLGSENPYDLDREQRYRMATDPNYRYQQSLARQGYDIRDLQAAQAAGQDITKIRPTRRKSPEAQERERLALERSRISLENARAPKPPKLQEYTNPDTGALFFEENLPTGEVRRTPQLEEGTRAQLYKEKSSAFKGTRLNEQGVPVTWAMDRGTYGQAENYSEKMPQAREYTDPNTGEVMQEYRGQDGNVTLKKRTPEGFVQFDPKQAQLWKQEADPLLGAPTVQSKYYNTPYGAPSPENKWEMMPTDEIKNLHANTLRLSDAAQKELERTYATIKALEINIAKEGKFSPAGKDMMARLDGAKRYLQNVQDKQVDADLRLEQIEAKMQEQGTLMKVGRVGKKSVEQAAQLEPQPKGRPSVYMEGSLSDKPAQDSILKDGMPARGSKLTREQKIYILQNAPGNTPAEKRANALKIAQEQGYK